MVDIQDNLFGSLAVRGHFVLPEQVNEALALQTQYESSGKAAPRLGEILAAKGYMTADQVRAVLQGQGLGKGQRFGELAVAWRLCNPEDLEAALAHQQGLRAQQQRPPRVGEILVQRGQMRPHQIKAVLQGQGKQIVHCPQCLARYNALNLTVGSKLTCPRCKNIFVPLAPAQDRAPLAEDEDVRADLTVTLPAIKDRESAAALLAPKLEVGGYQLSGRLGTDHSGVLYKAFHPQTGTYVALRMLSTDVIQGAEQFDQWVSAGQAASELNHPHLQRIHFMGSEAGRAFLVMEFIEGKSLRQRLREQGRMPLLEALEIMIQCGEALAYGHARDLIHGDLRPNYILIGLDSRVRLAGLGTPKHVVQDLKLMAGQGGPVPLYAAPEILIDEETADERSDIYSLAAVGYHLVTGRAPHEGSHFLQAGFRAAAHEVLPPRALDPALAPYINRLLLKGLSPEPDDRYASITALLADLRKCRGGLLIQAPEIPDLALDAGKHVTRFPRPRPQESRGESRGRRGMRTHKLRSAAGAHARPGRARPSASGVRAAVARRAPSPPGRSTAQDERSAVLQPEFATPMPPEQAAQALALELNVPEPLNLGPVEEAPGLAAGSSSSLRSLGQGVEQVGEVEVMGTASSGGVSRIPVVQGLRRRERPAAPAVPPKPPSQLSSGVLAGLIVGLGVIVLVAVWALQGGQNTGEEVSGSAPSLKVREMEKTESEAGEAPVLQAMRKDYGAQVEAFLKSNPDNHPEILRRLDAFLIKFAALAPAPETVATARALRQKHAEAGAAEALSALQETLQKMCANGHYKEAAAEAARWKDFWKDPAAEAAAAEALGKIQASEKSAVEEQLAKAKTLREQANWSGARALYDEIVARHGSDWAARARSERLKTEQAEREALLAAKAAEERQKEAQATAQRNAAAPARFTRLLEEVRGPFAHMDLQEAGSALDAAADDLAGTPKGPDLQALKSDLKRLQAMLNRMGQLAKEGKLRDLRIPYQSEAFAIVDAHPSGPVLEVKGGRVELKWTDLKAENLDEIARRATDFTQGSSLAGLGLFLFYQGQMFEAEKVLRSAGKLGAAVDALLEKVMARQKDLAVPKESAPVPAAVPSGQDKSSDEALKASGWEVSKGLWRITPEKSLAGERSPGTPVISLMHEIKRFASLSVELRGDAEAAGFSFGEKMRFLIKPTRTWQKLALETGANDRLRMRVDGVPAASLEDPGNVTGNQLPGQVYLRGKNGNAEFRNFLVDGKPVGAVAEGTPAPEAPAPEEAQDPAAAKALEKLGWEIAAGAWSLQDEVLAGQKSAKGDVASVKRALKNFKSLSVELRGEGDAAGFSFGQGRRFLVKPTPVWTKVTLQRFPDGSLSFFVNDEARASLEDTAGVKGADLGEALYLHNVGRKTEFKNFKAE